MYTLYYYPGSASLAPHLLMHEMAINFNLELVDQRKRQQKSAEYLAVNRKGVIPTLVGNNLVLTEAAAICIYLAEQHSDRQLAPPAGTPARAAFYEWMVYLTNTIQNEAMIYHYPERYASHPGARVKISAAAEERLEEQFRYIDSELTHRPYLLGDHLSACDFYLLMLARWARTMQRPPRSLPRLGALLRRLLDRPAVMHCFAAEALEEPFI